MSKSEKNAFFSKPFNGPILIFWNLILYTFLCTKIKKFTMDNIFSHDACSKPMSWYFYANYMYFYAFYELIFLCRKYICANIRFLHVCYRAVLDKMPGDMFLSIHLPTIILKIISMNTILPLSTCFSSPSLPTLGGTCPPSAMLHFSG